jgi:L-alanine-DL-glutamate epimerase-like enolase superfamily enzyme
MQRREFLMSLPLAAMMPQMRSAPRLKITDIRMVNMKVVRETGMMEPAWSPGSAGMARIGGGAFIEIHTDQGLTGIGPAMDAPLLGAARNQLIGKDPFNIEQLAGPLRYYVSHGTNQKTIGSLEIALWDLIGKAAGQPLYKLWGAHMDRVMAYASMIQLSTPEERVRMAVQLKSEGWKAIKLRAHYQTLKEDVQLVEGVRKAVGDDMVIMVDANQAGSFDGWQAGVMWDFRRALDTAREYERLNCAWLEEPLPRYAFDELAELCRRVNIPIAGGESNRGVHEFRWILEQNTHDIVQPDVLVADGVTGFRQIAQMAQAHNKPIIPHHGGGNIGTIAELHAIATWPNSPWMEILHDPPIAAYTNGFTMMANPPFVDKEGYFNLPQGPGLGVEVNKDLIVS